MLHSNVNPSKLSITNEHNNFLSNLEVVKAQERIMSDQKVKK